MATKKATKKTKKVEKAVVEEVVVETPTTTPEAEGNPIEEEAPVTVEEIEKAVEKLENPKADPAIKRFKVHTNGWFIKMQAYRTPIPMYQLPEDIRKYLLNKGFGTNVWEKSDEWLEKHHADKAMIEKLKKFISENYL